MKKIDCLEPIRLFAATVFLLICGTLHAQNHSKDEAAINKQVDAMINSWNNHNYDDMKSYTTENTKWVNGVGMWWKGRKESQHAHQAYHGTMFKESVMEKKSVTIRFVTKDVVIAHLVCHLSGTMIHEGKKDDPEDILETLVYVKVNGKWLMAAGVVVPIVKEVQQYDPVLQMQKN